MEMLSGAEMVVRSLIDQGVKQVFGYPGGAVLDIYDALHTVGGIDHVLVRHEQAAVHMADGLARATGEVGVVLVTSGPGATNAITGIATAYMDSIPLVILSGQVATSLIGYDAFQECDMVGISRPVVKHSFLVKQTEDIPQVLKRHSGWRQAVVLGLWWLIYRKTFLIRRTNYRTSGRSRSVCALITQQRWAIRGRLNARCKRWWRRKTGNLRWRWRSDCGLPSTTQTDY